MIKATFQDGMQMAGGRAVPIEYDLPQSEVKKRQVLQQDLSYRALAVVNLPCEAIPHTLHKVLQS